jgi:hypothetical protein
MCALAPSSAADICDMSSFGQPTAQQRAAFTYIELFAGIGGFRGGPSTQWADAASSPQKSTASPETHPRSGGLQITKAAKLQAAAQASGHQTMFSQMRTSARQAGTAASAAAAAPQALATVDAVASAVAECTAAHAASKKAVTDALSALRRGELKAPSSEAEAGLIVHHFSAFSCLTHEFSLCTAACAAKHMPWSQGNCHTQPLHDAYCNRSQGHSIYIRFANICLQQDGIMPAEAGPPSVTCPC